MSLLFKASGFGWRGTNACPKPRLFSRLSAQASVVSAIVLSLGWSVDPSKLDTLLDEWWPLDEGHHFSTVLPDPASPRRQEGQKGIPSAFLRYQAWQPLQMAKPRE